MSDDILNTTTRVGRDKLLVRYRGVGIQFTWHCDKLWLATDANGDVWAYNRIPVHSEIAGSGWDCNSNISHEEPVHYFYTDVSDWADSLVEYKV